jgi:uncharacterized protein with NAD-binding domain and iron-sulfur cluster
VGEKPLAVSQNSDVPMLACPAVQDISVHSTLLDKPAVAHDEKKCGLSPAAITSVHFWFDRPITDLPHAAVIDRTTQWLFFKPIPPTCPPTSRVGGGQYCQAVVSASHRLGRRTHDEWADAVRGELEELFPAARSSENKLLHVRTVTHPSAVFSITPESETLRPGSETAQKNLFLAGDWTATGWPATMEGAIRSGRTAMRLAEGAGV